ncbi:MAG: hypothetical protein CM15mP74_28060 [Halieaceae bacterium]|nr:MAG: hypothetical protein CM15mP74_28060 [Halieaceae bacterium]
MEGREYLIGDFSAADTMLGHACIMSKRLGIVTDEAFPNLSAYADRLMTGRPVPRLLCLISQAHSLLRLRDTVTASQFTDSGSAARHEPLFRAELDKNQANFAPLTPVSVLKRTERVYPDLPAQIHGSIRRNWGEVAERCKRLASALSQRGVGKGTPWR